MPLIEREREIERIEALLGGAIAGRGAAVMIEGEPGIGKTALLEVAGELARARGMTTLLARGGELEREVGFGVVRALLEPPLRRLDTAGRDELLTGAARLAERPLGLGADLDPGTAEVAPDSALHGLYWLCANLADRGPLLVAVDDLQWADEPSLRFLSYLVRRIGEHPLLVCGTSRPPQAAVGGSERLLAALGRDWQEALHPRPLSGAGVAELIRARAPEAKAELCAACARATGGNPFLVAETLAALRADGIDPAIAEPRQVEAVGAATLSEAMLARIARAGPEATAVTRALWVLGDDAYPRRVARLAGLSPEAATAVLDGLRREGIITPGPRLAFAHPLIRHAVDADLNAPARALAHGRAAELLADEGESPARIARHLLNAEPFGNPSAVEILRAAAGAAVARGAPEPAATLLERALAEPPNPDERAPLMIELGRARALTGHTDAAAETLGEAIALAGDPGTRARAAIELGQVLSYRGDVETAAETVLAALQAAAGHREIERPLQMMLLVMAETAVGGRRVASDLLHHAAEVVDRRGEGAPRGLLALIAFERAVAEGTAEAAVELAELALANGGLLAEQGPESPHAFYAAGALSLADRHEGAERALGPAIADAAKRGSTRAYALGSATRAWSRFRRGDLPGAEADARACLELAAAADWGLFRPQAVAVLANVLLERGDPNGAAASLDQVELDPQQEGGLHAPLLRESRTRLHLARGAASEALAELEACAAWERAWGAANSTWVAWRPQAALAHAALGDLDQARQLAAEGVELARRFGASRGLGIALRSLAAIEGGERELELLTESASVLEGSDAELERAHSLIALGMALRRAGQRRAARDPLRDGLAAATRCGASTLAERARAELELVGAKPHRTMLSGLESLTAAELRVAKLAAEGSTNREIAQALFVTRRTVETHLTSVYRKLEIATRDELPAALNGELSM